MSNGYGVQPTGFVRKPLSVMLAQIEEQMITEFGSNVNQTPQTELGQLNGMFANLATQVHESVEECYHARDPDQAEGVNLDALARMRQIVRNGRNDAELSQAITNKGTARIDLADILSAVKSVDGVTFARVYTNETTRTDENGLDAGSVAVAVLGGNDEAVADAIRQHVAPGTIFYGNTYISTNRDGQCRSIAVVRPFIVPVELSIKIVSRADENGCPPPSIVAIAEAFVLAWAKANYNGKDVNYYNVRTLIERTFPNVQVLSVTSSRDDGAITDGNIGFIEISDISEVTITQ